MYILYGLRREDFSGVYQAWTSTLHPEDIQLVNQEIQAAVRGEREYAPEFRIVRPDASIRIFKATSQTFRDQDGKAVRMLGTNIDITEQKLAIEKLSASEKRFATVFENSPLVVCIIRFSDMQIMEINLAFVEQFGFTREEVVGHTGDEIGIRISQEDGEGFRKILMSTGRVNNFETQVYRKSGELVPVLISTTIIEIDAERCMLLQIVDVSERKIAERNLLQRTEDLLLIKTLNDAANRGEDMDGIAQMFARETRSTFNSQDVNIYVVSSDSQYIEMQSTTVSQKLLDKVEKLIGRSIPKIRIPLNEGSFFKELLTIEQGTLISGKKLIEHWMSEFTETTYLPESLRSISKKLVPHVLKIINIRSVLLIPLVFSGQTIGLMSMTSRELLTDETHQRLRNLSTQLTGILLRKQLENRGEVQLQRLNALREIDRAISSSMDMRLSLDTLLTQTLSQLNVDAASILLLDAPSQMLEYSAGKGFRSLNIRQSSLQLGEGLAGKTGLERKTVHIADLGVIGTQFHRKNILKEENFVEYFGVPLIAKGVLKGVLELFNRTPLDPDLDWLNFLETLGGQAAIAIDNVQLFESMQQSNQELITAYDATIAGWSHAMDLRDKETEGHTQRVTNLTMQLARKMGINQQEMVQVRRGSLLHDIGKLGVPDNILLKPGKLTDEEWVIMRQHPINAFNMLMPITYLRPAMDIPYCHHEKWDGTGYPRGLKGEQIPLVARIFSIIDVWDALRSDRPYRAGWTAEKTREHIIKGSGTHFDPQVVEAFLSLLDESPDLR